MVVITGSDISQHTRNAKFFAEMLISVNIKIPCIFKCLENF